MKESLLLLKGLLEIWQIKPIDIWYQLQKMVILVNYMIKLMHTAINPSTIKMKPDYVKTSAYTAFEVENNDTEPKLKLAIL